MAGRHTDLGQFVEWGGAVWQEQVTRGLDWLGELDGLHVLEIGTRSGAMATLFAVLGASVTAVDVSNHGFPAGKALAARHNVAERVRFLTYSGKPEDLPWGHDVIFSKSTLVLIPRFECVVRAIADRLPAGGRFVAVENARGSWPVHLARLIRRRSLRPHGARYFTRSSVTTISRHLHVAQQHWTAWPPTVLVCARKET